MSTNAPENQNNGQHSQANDTASSVTKPNLGDRVALGELLKDTLDGPTVMQTNEQVIDPVDGSTALRRKDWTVFHRAHLGYRRGDTFTYETVWTPSSARSYVHRFVRGEGSSAFPDFRFDLVCGSRKSVFHSWYYSKVFDTDTEHEAWTASFDYVVDFLPCCESRISAFSYSVRVNCVSILTEANRHSGSTEMLREMRQAADVCVNSVQPTALFHEHAHCACFRVRSVNETLTASPRA